MSPVFAFFELSGWSIVILLILGALLFGKQLPSVGNWLGKTVKSVQDGLHGVESDVTSTTPRRDPALLEAPKPPQRIAPMTPKFEDQPTGIQQPPGVQQAPPPQA
jgi:Sec-independent protein translocase protein TatA